MNAGTTLPFYPLPSREGRVNEIAVTPLATLPSYPFPSIGRGIIKIDIIMTESLKTKFFRWGFNFWPCYRGTGGRITFISQDWRKIGVKIPLSWRTRNYVGTIYGGSMYGALDPIYMIMLLKILGKNYVVWDKAASIQFKRPGRSTLHARFVLEEEEIQGILSSLENSPSLDRVYTVELRDSEGTVCAVVEKTVYIRKK